MLNRDQNLWFRILKNISEIFSLGVKSKKEDWLKCDPVKQKKLEEISTGEMTSDYLFWNTC